MWVIGFITNFWIHGISFESPALTNIDPSAKDTIEWVRIEHTNPEYSFPFYDYSSNPPPTRIVQSADFLPEIKISEGYDFLAKAQEKAFEEEIYPSILRKLQIRHRSDSEPLLS